MEKSFLADIDRVLLSTRSLCTVCLLETSVLGDPPSEISSSVIELLIEHQTYSIQCLSLQYHSDEAVQYPREQNMLSAGGM